MPGRRAGEPGLWRHADFLKLWAGETVSAFGSHVSAVALPLTAVLALHASPAQMGLLAALQSVPFFVFTLVAGVWVEGVPKRRLVVLTNLGRGALLALVPLAAAGGWLGLELLYAVAFLAGTLQVVFELAYQAFVPALVPRTRLVEANGRLVLSTTAAQVAGPGLGGLLVERLGAPLAVTVDAASFLVAAAIGARIRTPGPTSPRAGTLRHLPRQVRAGLALVVRDARLRALMAEAAVYNVWGTAVSALVMLYAGRELGLRPAVFGSLMAAGSGAAVAGSLLADRIRRRAGLGRALMAAYLLACAAPALIPLAGPGGAWAVPLLLGWACLSELGLAMSNVYVVSLRQALIPEALFARTNAAYRFVVTGFAPLGGLVAGVLGELLGLRAALTVAALGTLSALPWVVFSPIPRLRDLPEPIAGAAASEAGRETASGAAAGGAVASGSGGEGDPSTPSAGQGTAGLPRRRIQRLLGIPTRALEREGGA